jgi:hypothetical protein
MNLYLISQDQVSDYDVYDSAVVAAPDEDTARNLHPGLYSSFYIDGVPHTKDVSPMSKEQWEELNKTQTWCTGPEHVKVEYLGIAKPGIKLGVICASYIALGTPYAS